MLVWVDNNIEITEISKRHKSFFEKGLAQLLPKEIEDIEAFINNDIDSSLNSRKKGEKHAYVPGWRVPKDWSKTPLQIIYDKAFPKDDKSSALWYGLMTMQVIIDRDEKWAAVKTQFNGRSFDQTVYWLRE